MEKFINPFSDYGFKKIFGSEVSKDLIISFLNSVLQNEVIVNITFRNVEMLGMKQEQRKAVFGSRHPSQILGLQYPESIHRLHPKLQDGYILSRQISVGRRTYGP